jgi:hypothetical protein
MKIFLTRLKKIMWWQCHNQGITQGPGSIHIMHTMCNRRSRASSAPSLSTTSHFVLQLLSNSETRYLHPHGSNQPGHWGQLGIPSTHTRLNDIPSMEQGRRRCLAQGVGVHIEGSNTIIFIPRQAIPQGKVVIYGRFVFDISPNKSEVHRVCFAVGGNLPHPVPWG